MPMPPACRLAASLPLVIAAAAALVSACADERPVLAPPAAPSDAPSDAPSGAPLASVSPLVGALEADAIAQGRSIFRFDTFGDETFWTDTLRMHEVIRSSLSPRTALALGLKVDLDALPEPVKGAIRSGTIDLDDPAVTVALLKLGAVLGVVGRVNEAKTLTSVGITCALCHSTVDNSFAPGIGRRLDGWPNRTLNVGAIIATSPALTAAQKAVYRSWGPGKYDPRYSIDGQNSPVVLPPAFGLRNVSREIYTGDDAVTYWNAYVAITQMHGHGRFVEPRLNIAVNNPPDLVSSKLPALRAYQFSLEKPAPRPGSYDAAAAERGRGVFNGVAGCARCHAGAVFTDVNAGVLHAPATVGQDPTYALRSVTKRYRTTPLRGLWNPPLLRGPYFHDGKAATLEAVVAHYVTKFGLTLTIEQRRDLGEYLKTL
jgi:cytochrome c553